MGRGRNGGAGGTAGRQRKTEAPYRDMGGFSTDEARAFALELVNKTERIQEDDMDTYLAMNSYQGSGFAAINMLLRDGKLPVAPEIYEQRGEAIAKFLDRQSFPENVIVYRGWREAANLLVMHQLGVLDGAIIDDKGFMSTSLDSHISKSRFMWQKGSAHFKLKLKAGTKAHVTEDTYESEILVQRGSRIKVTRSFMGENGNLEIEGEIIQ